MQERNRSSSLPARTRLLGAVRRELSLWSQAPDHFLKKVQAYRAENTKPFAREHTRPSLRKEILIDSSFLVCLVWILSRNSHS